MKSTIRWIPSILMMLVIFEFSSIPSVEMPDFGLVDTLIKKAGHALGYGMLALSYWYALGWKKQHIWLSFALATIYALSDEFHQAYVPGRNPSLVDALVIDTTGAAVALVGGLLLGKMRASRKIGKARDE